ncbi:MAG TPA: lysylphosphatidylglycerol synthase transmembrane domain-containing protein [Polyangiaceae bacterium]
MRRVLQPDASNRRWSRALKCAAKVAVGVVPPVSAAVLLRRADLHAVIGQVSAITGSTVLFVLAACTVQITALASRFWLAFPPDGRPPWHRVIRAFGMGHLANSVLPARVGDVIKVVALARPTGESERRATTSAQATGALVVDKVLDAMTLTGLAAMGAPTLLRGAAASAGHGAWVAVAAAGALVVAALVVRRWRPAAFARVASYGSATWTALRSLRAPRRLAAGLGFGLGAWLAEASAMLMLSAALGLHVSPGQAVLTLLVLNLCIAVPVSIGNVGVYEAAFAVALAPFGLSAPQALTLGALHHGAQLATELAFAVGCWAASLLASRSGRGLSRDTPRIVPDSPPVRDLPVNGDALPRHTEC